MPRKKKCCGLKRYEAAAYVLGVLLILNGIPLLAKDPISSLLSLVAGLLLVPPAADHIGKMIPAFVKPQLRFLIVAVCILILTARTEPYGRNMEQSDTGLWSTVCLKDCDNEQGSKAAQILDNVRDCRVLRDMYDVTPGNIDRIQWVRMVRARARILECPNL